MFVDTTQLWQPLDNPTREKRDLAMSTFPYFYVFNIWIVFKWCVCFTVSPVWQLCYVVAPPHPPDHPAAPPTRPSKGLVHSGVKSLTRGKSLVFISNFQEFLMKCCEVVICPFARQARGGVCFLTSQGQMWARSTPGWAGRDSSQRGTFDTHFPLFPCFRW